ncbi:DUF4835 family protein, partial [Flavobacterium sp.]|uniref:type IX secretion system protein PorD n=1 Tax=Flavobacterium sp. TaxID=239 RepID=UPI003750F849
MRKYLSLLVFLSVFMSQSQELNCKVVVDYSKLAATNSQVFKNLQLSLNDFVNKTAWTDKKFEQNERIDCSIFITLNGYDSNQFDATIQVQSSRTIFNSTYSSPILNINDKDFSFRYIEFEALNYNPNSFDSNLMSVIAFYANIIIGIDAESFSVEGGNQYFEAAQNIVNQAAQGGYKGWNQSDGGIQNRYFLISDLVSSTYKPYRDAMLEYHFNGLDGMATDLKTSKQNIITSINTL